MQFQGKTNMEAQMEAETKSRKMQIAGAAGLGAVVTVALGSTFLAWMINVNNVQKTYEAYCAVNGCDANKRVAYDFVWRLGPYTDFQQFEELFHSYT